MMEAVKEQSRGVLRARLEDFEELGLSQHEVESWEDGQRLPDEVTAGMYEWWYFDVHLDDGATLVTSYHTLVDENNIHRPYILCNYKDKDNNVTSKKVMFKPEEYSTEKDYCHVQIDKNYMYSKDMKNYEIVVNPEDFDGFGYKLKMVKKAPSYRPGTGKWQAGDKHFNWVSAVPAGDVEGVLMINGEEVKVKGCGYHDHNWANTSTANLFSNWFWGRVQVGENTAILTSVRFNEECGANETPIMFLASNGEVTTNVLCDQMDFYEGSRLIHPKSEKLVNNDVIGIYQNDDEYIKIRFNGNKDILTTFTTPQHSLPGWEAWYTRFNASITVEVKKNNEEYVLEGSSILEHLDTAAKYIGQ